MRTRAESDLVDDCNIYWMWILPKDVLPLRLTRRQIMEEKTLYALLINCAVFYCIVAGVVYCTLHEKRSRWPDERHPEEDMLIWTKWITLGGVVIFCMIYLFLNFIS